MRARSLFAHPGHVSTRTGLTPATSPPGLRSPRYMTLMCTRSCSACATARLNEYAHPSSPTYSPLPLAVLSHLQSVLSHLQSSPTYSPLPLTVLFHLQSSPFALPPSRALPSFVRRSMPLLRFSDDPCYRRHPPPHYCRHHRYSSGTSTGRPRRCRTLLCRPAGLPPTQRGGRAPRRSPSVAHICIGTWAHPCDICTRTAFTPSTSAPGLGTCSPHLHLHWAHPLPHLHPDWAHACHICAGTGVTPATSAPGLGSSSPHLHLHRAHPLPHLHPDWAHACHICAGTRLVAATSAPGLGSPLPHRHPHWARLLPHLRRDSARPSPRDRAALVG
jgi:hypothetical protein